MQEGNVVRRESSFKTKRNLATQQLQQAGTNAGGTDAGCGGFKMEIEQM